MSKRTSAISPALDAAIEALARSRRELQAVVRAELRELAASLADMWFVAIQRELIRLEPPLVMHGIFTIVVFPPTDLQDWIKRRVIVIVADETPFIADAASRGCGIISDALFQRDLKRFEHGWLLLLRENEQHDFRELSAPRRQNHHDPTRHGAHAHS